MDNIYYNKYTKYKTKFLQKRLFLYHFKIFENWLILINHCKNVINKTNLDNYIVGSFYQICKALVDDIDNFQKNVFNNSSIITNLDDPNKFFNIIFNLGNNDHYKFINYVQKLLVDFSFLFDVFYKRNQYIFDLYSCLMELKIYTNKMINIFWSTSNYK